MRESGIRRVLERLVKESESNTNRKVLGMRSEEAYTIEKESLIEDAISRVENIHVIDEINNLKRKLK